MEIIVRNQAKIPNKFVRFIKWKLYRLQRKFGSLLYVDLFLKKEGRSNYELVIRLGITGNDIILRHKSDNLNYLFSESQKDIHRYLARRHRGWSVG